MAERVYVTREIAREGIDELRARYDVDVNETDHPLTSQELRDRAGRYDALVTLLTDTIDRDILLAGRGSLKIVANVAVGYDNIDIDAATEAGVMVANTPGVLTDTTADFAWGLILAVARKIPEGNAFIREGKYTGWDILLLLGTDVHHKTLGILGFGRIGQAVARRAAGFDMRILYYDPVPGHGEGTAAVTGAEQVNLETLLRESDFISVHTPLTVETHHLIGAEQLRMMKRTAYIINTSRGPVIDERALAEALHDGIIRGAALDVFENEPDIESLILNQENTVLTPHIGSASIETRSRMARLAAQNVIAALSGELPPTLLNPAVLE
jgi:glyoxylate reductase